MPDATLTDNIRWFSQLRNTDIALVGGKNASLGELYSTLASEGVRVPNGFALTAQAYRDALAEANGANKLHRLLDEIDKTDVEALRSAQRRHAGSSMPQPAVTSFVGRPPRPIAPWRSSTAPMSRSPCAARRPPKICRPPVSPASTTAFSISAARPTLFEACRRCFASIFTDRAIVYRIDNGFDHFKVALSVGVMKMVRSDLAAAASSSRSTPNPAFATWCSSPVAMGSARTSFRAPSTRTSSMCTSRPSRRDSGRASRRARRKQMRMIYAKRRRGRHDPQQCHADGRARAVLPRRPGRARALPTTPSRSRTIIRTSPAGPCRWTSSGRRTARTASSTSSRPGRRPSPRAAPRRRSRPTRSRDRARCSPPAAPSARRSPRAGARDRASRNDLAAFRPGEVLVADTTTPDWEPVMKTAAGDRHRPRRPHLPCRHRRPRTRRAGGRRHRGRHRNAQDRRDCDRLLRGGRGRARLRGRHSLRDRRASTVDTLPKPHDRDHGQSGQSGSRLPHGRCCRTTASDWRGWSSSSASTSASTRWRWPSPKGHSARASAAIEADPRLCEAGRLLRRAAVGGRRHDRGGVLSQAR